MSNGRYSLVLIAMTMMTLQGCSMKDNLDDMHDKTSQMAKTTGEVAKTSDKLETLTEKLEATTGNTYGDLREGNTHDSRQKSFDAITEAKDMGSKLGSATAYYYGFEFQFWKGAGSDDAQKLDELKSLATIEFFEFFQKYKTPNDHFADDVTPLPPQLRDFYALAATLHKIRPAEEALGKVKGFQPISMLTIFEDSLRELKEHPQLSPSQMPKWMYYVQHYQEFATELIKARITYLPFQVYAEINHLNEMRTLPILWRTQRDMRGWNLNLYEKNLAQIARLSEYLRYTLQTRQFLVSIGQDTLPSDNEHDSLRIRSIYQHLSLVGAPDSNDPAALQKREAVIKFAQLVHLILAPAKEFSEADPAIWQ